ncbi:hypothetical protein PI124_g15359 [Phytophthora idaei]|nr:hypothetical protein PI125_g15319 [Phytophthora idaei]KAG3143978.1 hypothetical protein PI126_g14378 [Phytophthora idaei]KAG3239721.1 hypothetical protein PI124_g15359 [Phytophthora idaei]
MHKSLRSFSLVKPFFTATKPDRLRVLRCLGGLADLRCHVLALGNLPALHRVFENVHTRDGAQDDRESNIHERSRAPHART